MSLAPAASGLHRERPVTLGQLFALETRKLRRKHVPAMLAGMFAFEAGWMILLMPGMKQATAALAECAGMYAMLFPFTAGLLAIQIAGVDQQERMGQWLTARGQPPVRRFCVKLALANVIVIIFHLLQIAVTLGAAALLGLEFTPVAAELTGPLIAATTCGCIAVTAAHLTLAQLVRPLAAGIVTGLLAAVISSALPFLNYKPLGFALPWGLLYAADPARLASSGPGLGAEIVLVPDIGRVLIVAAALAAAWTALAIVLIYRKEQRS